MAAALAVAIYAAPTVVAQAQSIPTPAVNTQVGTNTAESTNNVVASATTIPLPVIKTLYLKVTAYTSQVDQTDSTPFITADGSYVHDGIVATNLLPFGTKVQIPSLFGDKIFTVDDRMAKRLNNNIDIWMANTPAAIVFGVHMANIVILGGGDTSPANTALSLNSAGSK